jgi:hypothetical protein
VMARKTLNQGGNFSGGSSFSPGQSFLFRKCHFTCPKTLLK